MLGKSHSVYCHCISFNSRLNIRISLLVISRFPEEIVYSLRAVSVPISEETINNDNDFSILRSSRHREALLMLGPLRFVNHSCEPNSEVNV